MKFVNIKFVLHRYPHKKISDILPWISCQLVTIPVLPLSVVLPVHYRAITVTLLVQVEWSTTKSH